jgi:integrase/recombinase XerD
MIHQEQDSKVLFEQFLQEKTFLSNLAPKTLSFYRQSFKAFALTFPLTQTQLNSTVVRLREQGMSANCVNSYIRGINPFLSWMFENKHLAEVLKLKKLKCEEKQMRTFSDGQIRTILSYKPKTKAEQRLLAVLTLLTDTGVRINEALTLTRSSVDFENLLLTVSGKGNKTRIIPFSLEARKTLFKHLRSHSHELVFSNRQGGKLRYDNLRRDFRKLIRKLGIQGFDGSFHAFRRYFVTFSIRKNVNPFLVQRMVGHSNLQMTSRYLRLETQDLSHAHASALHAVGGAR